VAHFHLLCCHQLLLLQAVVVHGGVQPCSHA
jgi:hypothetical protein